MKWALTCTALSIATAGCCETRTQILVRDPSQVSVDLERSTENDDDAAWLDRHVVREPGGALSYQRWADDDPESLVTSRGLMIASDLFGERDLDLSTEQLKVHKWVRRPDPGHRWSAIVEFSLTTPLSNVTSMKRTSVPIRFWGSAFVTVGAATGFASGSLIADGGPRDRATGIALAIPAAALIGLGLWQLLAPASEVTVPWPRN